MLAQPWCSTPPCGGSPGVACATNGAQGDPGEEPVRTGVVRGWPGRTPGTGSPRPDGPAPHGKSLQLPAKHRPLQYLSRSYHRAGCTAALGWRPRSKGFESVPSVSAPAACPSGARLRSVRRFPPCGPCRRGYRLGSPGEGRQVEEFLQRGQTGAFHPGTAVLTRTARRRRSIESGIQTQSGDESNEFLE